jgi:hypothetical protein
MRSLKYLVYNAHGCEKETNYHSHEAVHLPSVSRLSQAFWKSQVILLTVVNTLFKEVSANAVIGVTQKLVALLMALALEQNCPPTSAKSVELKYPQHLNCVMTTAIR